MLSQAGPVQDEEGSMANLVPGGRASERSRKGGAQQAALERERNTPLKINLDLQLVRTGADSMLESLVEGPSVHEHANCAPV